MALVDSTNALLQQFSTHPLHAIALRNELHSRVEAEAEPQPHALARSTTENLTSYTNLSDGSSYSIDPNDLKRLSGDLEAYKTYFGQVKFQWMESNVKRRYLQRLLGQQQDEAEQGIVLQRDCESLEEVRGAKKEQLGSRKVQAEQLRGRVREVTIALDAGQSPMLYSLYPHSAALTSSVNADLNQQLTPAIEEARALSREIQDMELELAMLRNSRPEEERMTIGEANQTLEEQVSPY